MVEISQEDFESKIQDIIDGKYTRADLIKKIKIDRVTLNNKIQELYIYNQDLYFEFIKRFPYITREYTHIDYEAMIIDIMKKGYTKKEAADAYGIHDRTIARKINKVKESNPELVELYRLVAYHRKHKYNLPEELQLQVDRLEEKDVFIGGIYDERKRELIEREKLYSQSRMNGISDVQAYGSRRTLKDLSTLYRLEIEQGVRSNQTNSDSQTLQNVLAASITNSQISSQSQYNSKFGCQIQPKGPTSSKPEDPDVSDR